MATETFSPLRTRPLHPLFGAELFVDGLADAGPGLATAIERVAGTAGLLLIRDVAIDDEGLARFAAHFGPLQNLTGRTDPTAGIFRVTNLDDDGALRAMDDPTRVRHDANKLWHADSSYMPVGATWSFLHARIVPAQDKDTLFCDGRVAWDALPPDRQRDLLPRRADHSMDHSWRLAGVDMPRHRTSGPMTRDLVRCHPPSGRLALVIPSHVERIDGLDYEAGRALLDDLTAIAAAPDRVYRHKWAVGDLLIWDNRCMLHRVSRRPGIDQPRDLRTCRIVDTEDAAAAKSGEASC